MRGGHFSKPQFAKIMYSIHSKLAHSKLNPTVDAEPKDAEHHFLFFCGLDVEIRPKWTSLSCLSTCGGVMGLRPTPPLAHPRGPSPGPRGAQARAQEGPKPGLRRGLSPSPRRGPSPGPRQKFGIPKNPTKKFSKSKSTSPKMSARSGLVRKNHPGPIWGHPGPFFAWAGKMQKLQFFAYFPWWANGPYSPVVALLVNHWWGYCLLVSNI